MTAPAPPRTLAASIPTAALIGLREGADAGEWARIRAGQLQAGRRLAAILLVANLMAGGATAFLLLPFAPHWWLTGWVAALAATAGGVALRRHRAPPAAATLATLRHTAWEGMALAAVWAVALLLLADAAPPAIVVALDVVLGILTIGAALATAPLAAATLVFIAGTSAATAWRFAASGYVVAAAGQALVAILLGLVCIARARALVQLRAAEAALAERDHTVSLLLRESEDSAADWLWETDTARRIVRASPRFAFACGLDPVSIDGRALLEVLAGPSWQSGNFAPGLRTLAEKLKARDSFRDLRLPVQVSGEERWWELAASPRFDDDGAFAGFRGVGSDVTEQRASADKINRMARYDALTGLPNRLMLNETLARAIAESEGWGGRCAFLMIDLDRFKAVNDSLGHPIGDRLLGRVSERLAQLMGADALCGRLGGDEFAVVIRQVTDIAAVERIAQRIIDTLSRPYELDQHTLHIGASIGLAFGPRDGRTTEMLIRSADLALYRAKDKGRGVFHAYEPALHAQAEERRVLEMALRTALEKGQMHLAYQPVVDAGSGALIGFEALLRWIHPELGQIPPAKFIPLAEDARLIGPIGEWVLRTACHEAARWPEHIRVAVNISPDQLQHPNFVTMVASALASAGLSPQRLELEVTESVFMHEGLGATRILERVIELGVRLSLDDFGTGYSSLGYLSRTKFSSIKIDRSFVQAAAKGVREAIAIIRAVVALATSLDMATTAEGVETETEHRMVQGFGCTKVQGYYFGRPLPAQEARTLAIRHRQAA